MSILAKPTQAAVKRLPSPTVPNGHREGRLEDLDYQMRLAEKYGDRRRAELEAKYGPGEDAPRIVQAAAAGAFQTLSIAAVTLMVVVFVVMMIDDALEGSIERDEETGEPLTELGEAYDTVADTLGDAFNLAAVALIVLVAAVILWYVSGFGDNGQRLG